MKILLDTCVLSETQKANGEPAVQLAVEALGKDAYISVITIGEILKGAELLAGIGAREQTWSSTDGTNGRTA